MDKLLTPQELAQTLNVKPGTVYSWISRGIGIPFIKISGTIRFREKSVEEWLKEKEREQKKRKFES
jgi:excisionase family DNA binding protein